MNKLFVCIISCFVFTEIGCAHKIKHPPTFDDFAYVYRSGDPLLKDVIDLQESLKFTNDEKQLIKKTKEPVLLIGAGVQSARSDTSGLEMLRKATEVAPYSPLTWASLAYHEIDIFLYEDDKIVDYESIKKDLTSFGEADLENSIPFFLKAFLYFKNGEIDNAVDLIKKAKDKSKTVTYELDIRRALIDAAVYVGYPNYTSKSYAIGFDASTSLMVVLVKDIVEAFPKNKELLEIFLEFGKKLEQQAKLNIEIMSALVIQSQCLHGLGYDEDDIQIKELVQKGAEIREYTIRSFPIPLTQISEARWVLYFDELFSLGELRALKNLDKEYEVIKIEN